VPDTWLRPGAPASEALAAERSLAVRYLLARPYLVAEADAEAFALVARHRGWLVEWFEDTCGWGLTVDVPGRTARLAKRSVRPDPTRPVRRHRGANTAFDRRRYELLARLCAHLVNHRTTTIGLLAQNLEVEGAGAFQSGLQRERSAFVDALRLLASLGVVSFEGGDVEGYVADRRGNALVLVDAARLHQLLVPPTPVSRACGTTTAAVSAALRAEPRYGPTGQGTDPDLAADSYGGEPDDLAYAGGPIGPVADIDADTGGPDAGTGAGTDADAGGHGADRAGTDSDACDESAGDRADAGGDRADAGAGADDLAMAVIPRRPVADADAGGADRPPGRWGPPQPPAGLRAIGGPRLASPGGQGAGPPADGWRRARHSLARRVLDDPAVHLDELDDEERAYLATSSGRRWLRDRVAQAGFVLEERAEGLLAVDTEAVATDVRFPAPSSTAKQAALLLVDELVPGFAGARSPRPRTHSQLGAALGRMLAAHPQWAREYQGADGPDRLAAAAVEVLAAMRLVEVADHEVRPRPALARYGVARPEGALL
jgi:hypothetical protein